MMDMPADTTEPKGTNETPATNEKMPPTGIAAMQGETSGADTTPKVADTTVAPEHPAPVKPEPPPDNTPVGGPQVGVGELGIARKIETREMPERKLFTLTEDEAKKAQENEMYRSGGPERG